MLLDVSAKGQTKKKMKSVSDAEAPRDVKKVYFEKENKGFFLFFTLFGLYAVKRVKGQYVVSKVRFILFYLSWISYPLTALLLAIKFGYWVDPSEAVFPCFMQGTTAALALDVVPALQAYSLKFITKSLPEILETISELSLMEVGFETPMRVLENLREKAGKLRAAAENKQLRLDRLFNWLPRAMVLFSMTVFLAVSSTEYLMELDLQTLDKEVPNLVVLFICLTFPFLTTILIAVFTRWLRIVYRALHRHCKEVMPTCSMDQVLAVCNYVDTLQRLFVLLDDGFFRYTLSMNVITVTIGASICTARLMQDYTQIVYLGPLAVHCITLSVVCEAGERLMAQHEDLVAWLKREIRRQKIPAAHCSPSSSSSSSSSYPLLHLLDGLLECPPQITMLGGYRLNRGFLVTCLGFVLSYGTIANQVNYRTLPPDLALSACPSNLTS